ncbi:MAG: NeuD/PglB/VioB family sugar acetyltransferase [Terracidiphilus sp.]
MENSISQVIAPLLGANEPDALLVELFVAVGKKVSVGDPLCTLETTKATMDVEAESEGYIYSILVTAGQKVTAGTILFEISSEPPTEQSPVLVPASAPVNSAESLPHGLLITDKATRLAKELGVMFDVFPLGTLVTEAMVREFSGKTVPLTKLDQAKPISAINVQFDANELLIIGASGHAKTLIDLVRQANHYHLAGLVAQPPPTEAEVLGVPVLGGDEVLQSQYDKGIRLMAIGLGAVSSYRRNIFIKMAEIGFAFPRIVHPKAVVEPSAEIAGGVQVFGTAFIGSAAIVGFGALINTGAIVSHDCKIGAFAHIAPGAVLAGRVDVGIGCLIGMGVTTAVGVKIGEWARVGNGARINSDVPPRTIVQAGTTWP